MNEHLRARLNGRLPTIQVAGDVFVIDLANERLYLKDDPQRILWLDRMELDGTFDNNYYFYYNTVTKTLQGIDTDRITGLPANVVKVLLPHDGVLDPVFCAQGVASTVDLLIQRDHPIELDQQAVIIPLRQTNLQKWAIQNIMKTRDRSRGQRSKL